MRGKYSASHQATKQARQFLISFLPQVQPELSFLNQKYLPAFSVAPIVEANNTTSSNDPALPAFLVGFIDTKGFPPSFRVFALL